MEIRCLAFSVIDLFKICVILKSYANLASPCDLKLWNIVQATSCTTKIQFAVFEITYCISEM